jgi:hypothetical protein
MKWVYAIMAVAFFFGITDNGRHIGIYEVMECLALFGFVGGIIYHARNNIEGS